MQSLDIEHQVPVCYLCEKKIYEEEETVDYLAGESFCNVCSFKVEKLLRSIYYSVRGMKHRSIRG